MYLAKRVVYEEVVIEPDEVFTISEAAVVLGMTFEGVISAMNRGQLTEIVDRRVVKFRKGRRLLLKSEVLGFQVQKWN